MPDNGKETIFHAFLFPATCLVPPENRNFGVNRVIISTELEESSWSYNQPACVAGGINPIPQLALGGKPD